ncbi:methylene-tetrahydromethanopterin reductase [miscellaneous Crenarchaeota group-15 archaeon DG-45]|uniref:5,10-methylenetetrahydromethanopterin reductase n=1 Tax=miscellaneous Crenarchaeota group-15 archaeon DG-45 TaxID=1685127 RepID=A0A0M0BQY4_9ARCH|nr:MAG: methylene-tetrahydromethanopterin reductase [miscellaneous Crenarchaeota group-15 archaeon DG-45]
MGFGIEFVPMDLYWRTTYYSIQAERLGYDNIWITDHFNNRNVYVSLSAIANYTERIKIGPGVTNPYLVHPVMTAQSVASLNEVAPGRVVCGIGAGDRTTLDMVGVEMKSPLRTVREAVEVIRRQIAREKEGYEGSVFRTSPGARFNFRMQGRIPIYVGAQGPRMLQLAGAIGDGALINASHPEDVREAVSYIRRGAEEAGRQMDEIDVTAYTSFSIAEDEKSARKAVVPVVAYIVAGSPPSVLEKHDISPKVADRIRGDLAERRWGEAFGAVDSGMIDVFAVSGTPDQCVEKIDGLFETGITQFVTGSPLGPNVRFSIALFGREVFPHFKEPA